MRSSRTRKSGAHRSALGDELLNPVSRSGFCFDQFKNRQHCEQTTPAHFHAWYGSDGGWRVGWRLRQRTGGRQRRRVLSHGRVRNTVRLIPVRSAPDTSDGNVSAFCQPSMTQPFRISVRKIGDSASDWCLTCLVENSKHEISSSRQNQTGVHFQPTERSICVVARW